MDDYRELTPGDFFNGNAFEFMKQRILASDAGLKEDAYDSFGANLDSATQTATVLLFLYRFYFRTDSHGIANIPEEGPGLIVSNHAPILPFDATMLFVSLLVEPEKPRFVRTIVNRSISSIPFFSTLMYRTGQIIGCDENVRRIFENRNLVLVFPTGAEGRVHSIFEKYKLDEFPQGFMEYSLRYSTPIIPACVTGSEEAAMTLGEINLPLAGFKHLPVTPIFPWLGPLGLIPFPTKFNIYYDSPVDYSAGLAEGEADDPAFVKEKVEDLRMKIRNLLDSALGH